MPLGSKILRKANAHTVIAETAKELAGELYEIVMSADPVRKAWKDSHPGMNEAQLLRTFIAAHTVRLLPAARTTLAGMLNTSIPEAMKETIYHALIADNTLGRGVSQPPPTHSSEGIH